MPPIFYWFLGCFLVSLGGIIAAVILVVAQNRKRKYIAENMEQVYVKSSYKTSSNKIGSYHYFVEFVSRNGECFQIKVKQSMYEKLYDNDVCTLVHRKNKILYFDKKKTTNPIFFKETKSSSKTMHVSVSSPRFDIDIQMNDGIYASLDDTLKYLDRMLENKQANFIALKDKLGNTLEISGDDQDLIDLRYLEEKNIYNLCHVKLELVKTIVKQFYDKIDIVESNQFKLEK